MQKNYSKLKFGDEVHLHLPPSLKEKKPIRSFKSPAKKVPDKGPISKK